MQKAQAYFSVTNIVVVCLSKKRRSNFQGKCPLLQREKCQSVLFSFLKCETAAQIQNLAQVSLLRARKLKELAGNDRVSLCSSSALPW